MAQLNISNTKKRLEECISTKDVAHYKSIFKSAYRRGIKAKNSKVLTELLPYFNNRSIFSDADGDCFSLVFKGLDIVMNDPQWPSSFNDCYETFVTFLNFMEIEEVEHCINTLLPKAREGNHKFIEAQLLFVLSKVAKVRHNYQLSLLNLKQSLYLFQPEDDREFHTSVLIATGTIHRLLHNFDTALDYFEQAKILSVSHDLHSHYINAIEMKALLLMDANDLLSAKALIEDTYRYGKQYPNSLNILTVVWQAQFNIAIGAYKEAVTTLNSFFEVGVQRFNPSLHIQVLNRLGTAYRGLQKYDKAIECLWRSYDLLQPRYIECMELYLELLDIINEVLFHVYDGAYFEELSRLLTNVKLVDSAGLYTTYVEEAIVLVELTKIDQLLARIRKEETFMILVGRFQVDMNSGFIFKNEQRLSKLTTNQMKIFRLMYEKNGSVVKHEDIVKCTDYYYEDKDETPRRSHYYMVQLRNRFDAQSMFEPVRGIGYRLNM
ncbi:MAG: hypothetical protein KAR42_03000 [candidate division Zixibacteria bacterium]|nr:hypothetical protein [candidate division Zixibacteria bacterium]